MTRARKRLEFGGYELSILRGQGTTCQRRPGWRPRARPARSGMSPSKGLGF